MIKEISIDCKVRIVDSEAVLQTIEANPGASNISESRVVRHIHNLSKNIQKCRIVPKQYQNIAKLLTHPSNYRKSSYDKIFINRCSTRWFNHISCSSYILFYS